MLLIIFSLSVITIGLLDYVAWNKQNVIPVKIACKNKK